MKLPRPGSIRPARSLKNKLAALFFAIIALAFSVLFFYVVPQLESNLEEQKLDDIGQAATRSAGQLERIMGQEIPAPELDKHVRAVSDQAGAQITLLGVQRSAGGPESDIQFYVISDSRAGAQADPEVALAAAAIRERETQVEASGSGDDRVAQAARPLYYRGRADWVAIYSRSLVDASEIVTLIRSRILIASVAALLVALVGGYLVARALARRVRRLEDGAEQVAAGHFIEPLPVDSEDELGQLTRTFNEMQVQLSRVDRARREFIANASHELRTPIFSLGGFVELLQDEDLDEETREEFLQQMSEQVERLQKLAVDLLDLSRLDAGSLQLNSEQVDLAELARGVAREFAPVVTQHRTQLNLRLPRERVDATCDRERVAQIMRILLDNALRHTPEGTSVIVSAHRDNGAAGLTVADAGPGLDEFVRDQVFERFYTADAARGSGLGLAIAKELAERMAGTIRLDSRPGRTAFTLELPAAGDGAA